MQPATLSKNGILGIGSCSLSLYSIGWKKISVETILVETNTFWWKLILVETILVETIFSLETIFLVETIFTIFWWKSLKYE
jgi:hypothetical protein